MNLLGKVALVTGTRRIGAVVAQELAREGADVALVYMRSRGPADEAASAIRTLGRRAVGIQADLREADACARVVDETVRALGRLDILVNMASVYRAVAYDQLSQADWDDNVAVDLRASYLCARAAVPHMRAAGEGRIVNFSDWLAKSGRPRYKGYLPYYVAKAGVIGLTEALALELAADNILVNAVAPGPIVPPEGTTDEEAIEVEKATPLGRWGGELEVARAVIALIETEFVTGETLRVDGGRHIR